MIPYLILALYLAALFFIFISIDRNYSYFTKQMRKASRLNVRLKEKYQDSDINNVMKNAGVPFSLYHFHLFRTTVITCLLLAYFWKVGTTKETNVMTLALIVIFFIVTQTNEKLLGMTSPFRKLIDLSLKRKREQYNEELYLAIAQMKNSFLVSKDDPPSSQHVFEEIRAYTNRTREVFNKFLRYWMIGEKEQAVDFFEKEIGTKEAKKLSQVFMKLDDLNPIEMREQLDTFQRIYRTERETNKKKKNEFKSNILFIAVLATAIMIMVNFLVVGFFIDFIKDMNEIL